MPLLFRPIVNGFGVLCVFEKRQSCGHFGKEAQCSQKLESKLWLFHLFLFLRYFVLIFA